MKSEILNDIMACLRMHLPERATVRVHGQRRRECITLSVSLDGCHLLMECAYEGPSAQYYYLMDEDGRACSAVYDRWSDACFGLANKLKDMAAVEFEVRAAADEREEIESICRLVRHGFPYAEVSSWTQERRLAFEAACARLDACAKPLENTVTFRPLDGPAQTHSLP